MKKNVIIYCRVSTDKQSKTWESLESQEEQCRLYCKRNDYQVLGVFAEQFTWTKDKRPKVQEALEFIKNSELQIDHVIVLKIDRVSRWWILIHDSFKNQFKALWVTLKDTYWVIWEDKNVIEIEWINTDKYNWAKNNSNQIAENVTVMMSENERNTILQRLLWQAIKNNMRWYKVRNSEYWYKNQKIMTEFWKKTIQIENPDESKYIKKMFELKQRWDLTDKEITDEINLMWYLSRKKVKWNKEKTEIIWNIWWIKLSVGQLQKYIKMPIYAWVICEEWTGNKPIKAPYNGLVSIETWNIANKWRIKINELSNDEIEIVHFDWEKQLETPVIQKHRNYNPEYPYWKFLKCPKCWGHLTAEKSRSKNWNYHHYYSCRGKKWEKHKNYYLRRDETNEYIVNLFSELKFDKNLIRLFNHISKEVFEDRKNINIDDRKQVLQNIKELESKKDLILTNIQKFINYPDLLEAQNQELLKIKEEINQLEIKKEKVWKTMWLKRFQDCSKKILEHLDKLVIQRENPVMIQLIFEIIYDWNIEFEKIQSRTPITKEFLALNTKKESSKIEDSSLNVEWSGMNKNYQTIKKYIVKLIYKIEKWQYVIDRIDI